jgi:hypothetical protein
MVELSMERMAQNEAAARRVGDDRTADYWRERIEAANLAIVMRERASEWDVMKGSPDTSRLGNG